MNPLERSPERLPTGARDALPGEAAELRRAEDALRRTLRLYGYRELRTPIIEYAGAFERASRDLDEAYRLFDADGSVLVLRPDLTIPAARLIATRMAGHPGAVRASYTGSAFRLPQPGRPRLSEYRQAGAELVGVSGPAADAEIVELLAACLTEAGVAGHRIALGDQAVVNAVLDATVDDPERRTRLRRAAAARDLVAWRHEADGLDPLVAGLPTRRGGADVLERLAADVPAAADACRRFAATLTLLEGSSAGAAVLVDLGIVRARSYYDGVVIEAYAPGADVPVARGGRYDGLSACFGAPRAAVGFGIDLEPLHRAIVAAAGNGDATADGVVLVGGLGAGRATASALRARGIPVVALDDDASVGAALAQAEGWRYVAVPDGAGHRVTDRATGDELTCARIEEDLPSRR